MSTIDEIKKSRLEKLERFKKAGINPYPAKTKRTNRIIEVIFGFNKFLKTKKAVI